MVYIPFPTSCHVPEQASRLSLVLLCAQAGEAVGDMKSKLFRALGDFLPLLCPDIVGNLDSIPYLDSEQETKI